MGHNNLKLILCFVAMFSAAVAQADGLHGVRKGEVSSEPTTWLGMQERLITTAEQFREIGPLARAIHHDIAYPRDAEEYAAMNGFGILWVTSHSQIEEELPPKNMRIVFGESGTIRLPPIFQLTTIEEDQVVSSVLGEHRSETIYLIPFYKEVEGAVLLVDYAVNRDDFVLGELESNFPTELGKPKSLYNNELRYPDKTVVLSMLKREYPHALLREKL
tara:strand:- start:186 stop:839 length:654 start_codon:yes stop_codon:yes gene_type:complete